MTTADTAAGAAATRDQLHPVVAQTLAQRTENVQVRIADAITRFAGSMAFVYIHVVAFTVWMLWIESNPWPTLTLTVSLEAIFLSTFVMIGQNRQADFQQRKADYEFSEQVQELQRNTQLTEKVHTLLVELHAGPPQGGGGRPAAAPAGGPQPPAQPSS
jgi:uncharacterized membrane protein